MVTYAEEPCTFDFDRKAGHGFVSDGVPEPVGRRGKSERSMPPPLGVEVSTAEITKPYRKVES